MCSCKPCKTPLLQNAKRKRGTMRTKKTPLTVAISRDIQKGEKAGGTVLSSVVRSKTVPFGSFTLSKWVASDSVAGMMRYTLFTMKEIDLLDEEDTWR